MMKKYILYVLMALVCVASTIDGNVYGQLSHSRKALYAYIACNSVILTIAGSKIFNDYGKNLSSEEKSLYTAEEKSLYTALNGILASIFVTGVGCFLAPSFDNEWVVPPLVALVMGIGMQQATNRKHGIETFGAVTLSQYLGLLAVRQII